MPPGCTRRSSAARDRDGRGDPPRSGRVPARLNVFVLRNVLGDVSLGTIFRGVVPFWIADILRLLLLIAVPALSLWLVGAM